MNDINPNIASTLLPFFVAIYTNGYDNISSIKLYKKKIYQCIKKIPKLYFAIISKALFK